MEYQKLLYIDLPVSKIVFGTAGSGFLAGEDQNILLDAAFSMGINTFDTARNYGLSEKSLGKWIKDRQNRDQIVLISKCGHPDPDTGRDRINEKEIREDLETSLKLLNTSYLDGYLLHRDDPSVPVGEIIEIMNALKDEGKICSFGGSNWTASRLKEANDYALSHNLQPFTISSPNYGLAEQVKNPWIGTAVTLTGEENQKEYDWHENLQFPVFAYSSLARGLLSGKIKYEDCSHASDYLDEFAMSGYAYPQNFERLRRSEELAEKKVAVYPKLHLPGCLLLL